MRRFAETEERLSDAIGEGVGENIGTGSNDTGVYENNNDMAGSGDHMISMRSEDGLRLRAETKKSPYCNAYEIRTSFANGSDKPVTLEMMTSFLLPDIKADRLYRIQSFWSAEGRLKVDELRDLNMEHAWNHMAFRVEKFGNVGSMPVRKYFPFVVLEDSETHTFTGVQLYSPASWQIELVVRRGDVVTLAGGIADRDFGQWTKTIMPGEEFESPKAVAATGTSLEEVCDKLVKAQHPDRSPADDRMGIVFNEYCTTWGNPTIDNLKKLADRIAGKGIQYLVMDSGWYSDCGNWWEYRGDWSINRKRFPNGLKELADYIRERGMIPGIWFEFEVVAPKSGIYDDPAYFEHYIRKDGVPLTIGGARFWDMEDPYADEFLTKNVIGTLKENGFGYIKVDYNDTMGVGCDATPQRQERQEGKGADKCSGKAESFADSMRENGPGENLRRKVLATQEFFRKMRREIPDLVIENCSSGGHRLEPSFMELASQASFSDAHEIPSLPIIAANLHRVIRPEQSQIWAVMRAKDSDSRIYYSMCATFLGRMGLSGDVYDLSDHQWELVDGAIEFYKEAAPIIKDGVTMSILWNTAGRNTTGVQSSKEGIFGDNESGMQSMDMNETNEYIGPDTRNYNKPEGSQLVVRKLGNKALFVFHRFENSISFEDFAAVNGIDLSKYTFTKHYGEACEDFSAEARIGEEIQ
ncbi:MAG: alpha-galactosidase [Lachnospiraceae bacterium]|nr:alpha-galactosidase [Lachnospiraceae bacterium]